MGEHNTVLIAYEEEMRRGAVDWWILKTIELWQMTAYLITVFVFSFLCFSKICVTSIFLFTSEKIIICKFFSYYATIIQFSYV